MTRIRMSGTEMLMIAGMAVFFLRAEVASPGWFG